VPRLFIKVEEPVLARVLIEPSPEPGGLPQADRIGIRVVMDVVPLDAHLPEVDRYARLVIAVTGWRNFSGDVANHPRDGLITMDAAR